jgi:hypothetical protein
VHAACRLHGGVEGAPCILQLEVQSQSRGNSLTAESLVPQCRRDCFLGPGTLSFGALSLPQTHSRIGRTTPETPKRVVPPTFCRLSRPCLLLHPVLLAAITRCSPPPALSLVLPDRSLKIAHIDVAPPIAPHSPAILAHTIRCLHHRDSPDPVYALQPPTTAITKTSPAVWRLLSAPPFSSAEHTAHIHNGSYRETASSYVSPCITNSTTAVGASGSNNNHRP